jgi:Domain of unknown function (DUF4252)/Secretion system C-terminal sorting domain
MKQLLLSIAILALAITASFSQNTPLQDFIDKYKNEAPFSYAFLSKDMFDVAMKQGAEDSGWKKLHNVVRNIGSLSILVADSIQNGASFYKEALSAIPVDDFDPLLSVQDGKDRVRIWVREEAAVLRDLVLLVGTTNEFVLVCFSGNLELNNLTELLSLLDANSAAQLAKTSEALSVDFGISPNPNNGTFTLNFEAAGDVASQLTVLDQSGRQLSMINLSGAASQTVSVLELPTGVYWAQLKTQQGKVGVKQLQIMKMP